jgi:hypothetical protein
LRRSNFLTKEIHAQARHADHVLQRLLSDGGTAPMIVHAAASRRFDSVLFMARTSWQLAARPAERHK